MIDELHYLQRLGNTYLFVENIIGLGLTEPSQARMVHRLSGGVRRHLSDPKLWKNVSPEEIEKIISRLEEKIYKLNIAKVVNYKKWVLNYGLVMLCGVFDEFLFDLLNEALSANPQLCTWHSSSEILSRFKNENIKGKIKTFINRLKISESELFDFSLFTKDIRLKHHGFNLSSLIKIYKKRDKAAHTDRYVLNTLDELLEVKEIFDKLIFNLSLKFRKRFGVKSKMVETYYGRNKSLLPKKTKG